VLTRPAAAEDVTAIRELAGAAYLHYTARIGRSPAPVDADYPALVAAGTTWVAEIDRTLVGFVVLLDHDGYLLLDNVAVAPTVQGSGVGALLLELAEQQARRRGYGEIRLYTNEAMTENLTYYPRRGYRETHRAVEHGYRRVHFVKTLD
jgi:GNAT superfamily N-acetyltransferase